jgi:hypothetical protein
MPQSRHRYWTGRPAFFGGVFRAEETCHPEKLDQVEVMESEWIHLKLFSHASITVVGLTSDLGCRSSTRLSAILNFSYAISLQRPPEFSATIDTNWSIFLCSPLTKRHPRFSKKTVTDCGHRVVVHSPRSIRTHAASLPEALRHGSLGRPGSGAIMTGRAAPASRRRASARKRARRRRSLRRCQGSGDRRPSCVAVRHPA